MINRFRWCVCCAIILISQFLLLSSTPVLAAEIQGGVAESWLVASNSIDQPLDDWTDVIDEAIGRVEDPQSQFEPAFNEKPEELKVEVAPEPSPESLNREGAALVKSGNMKEAVSKFREALELDTSHVGARFNLAFAYHRLNRLEDAKSEYRKVLEIEDLTKAHLMLGLIYKEDGDGSNAINEFETVLKKEPDNKLALARLKDLKNAELEKAAL